jgi:hypothetical protein
MIRRASNPFESSAADWLAMADALQEAEDGRRRAEQLSVKLIAENEQLHDQLTEANTERKFWMGYAMQIETRLDVITGVIQDARNEAREAAKRFTKEQGRPPVAEAQAKPQPPQERRLSEVRRQAPRPMPQHPPEQDDDEIAADLVNQITALHNKWP